MNRRRGGTIGRGARRDGVGRVVVTGMGPPIANQNAYNNACKHHNITSLAIRGSIVAMLYGISMA